jgi:hypothetical protein
MARRWREVAHQADPIEKRQPLCVVALSLLRVVDLRSAISARRPPSVSGFLEELFGELIAGSVGAFLRFEVSRTKFLSSGHGYNSSKGTILPCYHFLLQRIPPRSHRPQPPEAGETDTDAEHPASLREQSRIAPPSAPTIALDPTRCRRTCPTESAIRRHR